MDLSIPVVLPWLVVWLISFIVTGVNLIIWLGIIKCFKIIFVFLRSKKYKQTTHTLDGTDIINKRIQPPFISKSAPPGVIKKEQQILDKPLPQEINTKIKLETYK